MLDKFDPSQHIFHSPSFQHVVDEAVLFFASTPLHRLPPVKRFVGSGVYALYYIGVTGIYAPLGKRNKAEIAQPIYIGKTNPTGWRTGRQLSADSREPKLFNRLREHAKSIESVRDQKNLDIDDFVCRFMILIDEEASLIGAIEASLISRYSPLWNRNIDGFGNHDPGRGRYNQARSEWDILHPGRNWQNDSRVYQLNERKLHVRFESS